jgi:hypothetical protein
LRGLAFVILDSKNKHPPERRDEALTGVAAPKHGAGRPRPCQESAEGRRRWNKRGLELQRAGFFRVRGMDSE